MDMAFVVMEMQELGYFLRQLLLCYTIVAVNVVHARMCAELRVCIFMRGGEMEQAGTEWPVWVWENFRKALV